jgi:hypothetical protein
VRAPRLRPAHSRTLAPLTLHPPPTHTLAPTPQLSITSMSDNFDMDAYNDAIKVFPAFKMIF